MSGKFTPGPWKHEASGSLLVLTSDGRGVIAGCWGDPASRLAEDAEPAEGIANARLIAAAPEMRTALDEADAALQIAAGVACTCNPNASVAPRYDGSGFACSIHKAREVIRAAIAKAEGR